MPHFDKTFNTLWEWATDDGRRTPAEAYAYLGRKAEAKRDFEHACTPYGRSLIQDLNLSQQDALRMLFTDVREELRIAADLPDPEDEQSQISWARRIGRFLKNAALVVTVIVVLVLGYIALLPLHDEVLLRSTTYVVDPVNHGGEIEGATLQVDKDGGTATVKFGRSETKLRLVVPERSEDRWRGGCRTFDTLTMMENLEAHGAVDLGKGRRKASNIHARCPSGLGAVLRFEDGDRVIFVDPDTLRPR